jgi:hypothetical protein
LQAQSFTDGSATGTLHFGLRESWKRLRTCLNH